MKTHFQRGTRNAERGNILLLLALLLSAFLAPRSAFADGTPTIPASQTEVNAGVIHNKYVAPDTYAGTIGNVMRFGVVANGVTDTTTNMQRALNAGGEIFIPSGSYVVTNLYVTNNTHIRGGLNARLIQGGAATNWTMATGNNTNIQIEGLIFDGGLRSTPGALGTRHGLQMNLGTNGNSWVRYCEFAGYNGFGVQGTAPGGVLGGQLYQMGTVDHCIAKFCGYGFYQPELGTDSAEYSQWSECQAVSCFEGFYKTAGNVINIGHRVTSCTTGVELNGSGSNPLHGSWTGVTFNHNGIPIYAHGSSSGEQFSGGYCIANGPVILNGCTGFEFSGMAMDGRFIITNSAVGAVNFITGCRFQGDWQNVKAQQTNDSSAVYLGNVCWNNGGVTNSSDGSFGNWPYVVKPSRYVLNAAQTSGTFSTANTPTPYFDIGTIAWTASGAGGMSFYMPANNIDPCTNSITRVTVLNTNTATVTVTNITRVIMYLLPAGRAYVSTVIYPTLQFPQGYTTYTLTNFFTNTVVTRVVGSEFGQGNIVQNLYLTKFEEQPVQ